MSAHKCMMCLPVATLTRTSIAEESIHKWGVGSEAQVRHCPTLRGKDGQLGLKATLATLHFYNKMLLNSCTVG